MRHSILTLVLCALAITACRDDTPPQKHGRAFQPESGKKLVFAHQDTYADLLERVEQLPFGITVNTSIYSNASVRLSNGETVGSLRELLHRNANLVPLLLTYVDRSMFKPLYTGELDTLIVDFAESLREYGRPIYLALGYEVNNPLLRIPADEYVRTYRYIVDKLTEDGIKNVSYVWPIISMIPRFDPYPNPMDYFPGEAYVNWIGLTMHNVTPAHFPESEATYFKAPDYERVLSISREKEIPILIVESSTRSVNKNFGLAGKELWDNWYEPFFDFVDHPEVMVFTHAFHNLDDDVVVKLFVSRMEEDKYVHVDPELAGKFK